MKNIFFYILILFSLLITNCDDVNVVDPQLNYKEYLVVKAELRPYLNIEGVNITKTIPINEPYDTNKTFIKNALVYLKINGVRVVPLHYNYNGFYKPLGALSPVPGETYELYGSVNNTSFYARTKIPDIPTISLVTYTNNHLNVLVNSKPGEVYGALWAIVNPASETVIDVSDDFLSIVPSSDISISPNTFLSTKSIPDQYNSDIYQNYRSVKVYAFDTPYFEYFNTKNNNQPVSDAFVQGGDQIAWNLQGKDVIGLFIGVAEGSYVHSN